MRFGAWALLVLTTTLVCNSASLLSAQSLTDKLIAEDPTKLAEQARKDGNIVRGAILFHQGNINCAKCHQGSAEKDRIGPDLSRLDPAATDAYIIESILQPSKQLKKGFEPVVVLTEDGKAVNGIIVSENESQVVIRDLQNVEKLTTLKRSDIDEMRPGKKSSMPDGLADQLKDRRQFLDLLRYVFDIKERGPSAAVAVVNTEQRRDLDPKLAGLVTLQKMNCVACHQSESQPSPVAAKQAPRLKWSAKWLNPDYIEAFVADPHKTKPGTTMPSLLGHLDDSTRKNAAKAITHFLASKAANEYQSQPIDGEAMHRGYELFQSVGCVACHSPRNESAVEQELADSMPLGPLHAKYNIEGLSNFLEDPLAVRPSGHMPNMTLEHREAVDISNFLLQSAPDSSKPLNIDAELVRKGELAFKDNNCAKCHTEFAKEFGVEIAKSSVSKLDALNSDKGCLSGTDGGWPKFDLTTSELEQLRNWLLKPATELTAEEQISVTLKSFNCIACHSRNDLGGVTDARNPHFKTTNLNLGDQGRIPPTLSGVGAKLQTKWMRDVLVNARSIRPYVKTRMPQYGEENIAHLPELFAARDKLAASKFVEFKDQKAMREEGHKLAGNKGLNCVACHTYQYKISDTMPAVDLTEMTERLKKDWFYQYMLEPQKFSPNTVMPSFWPGGNAIQKNVKGKPEEQIEALWQYLIDGRQARTPSGVVREPLEIVVNSEAQMLRRSYPGIGKRGIGVGYPGGINIAFDAEQMRLASVWNGKFADPAGVWTGQGHGNVRPMSRPVDFSKGPDLDSQTEPWVVDDGRPPNHKFKGYTLDKSRRPTFRYKIDSVDVEDFFTEAIQDAKGKTRLRRTLTMSANQGDSELSFRIASSKSVVKLDNVTFKIGDQLHVQILSNHKPQITKTEAGQKLEINLKLVSEKHEAISIEYWVE